MLRYSRAQQYSDNMDAAERVYTDNVMPTVAEGARQLLSALHDHKRAVLESSMYTLQEAQALLARLRGMSAEGASLDSRPLHIKTNIEFGELIFLQNYTKVEEFTNNLKILVRILVMGHMRKGL